MTVVTFRDSSRDLTAAPSRSGTAEAGERRLQAIAHANQLRALARAALRDGMPHGALRAATARTAARRILQHARRAALLDRVVAEAVDAFVQEQAALAG